MCMKKLMLLSIFVLAAGLLVVGCGGGDQGGEKPAPGAGAGAGAVKVEAKAQTLCPVMGNAIDKKLFVDYEGKRIYVCCPACIEKFKSDPEKYMKILADQGVTPADVPAGTN